MSSNYKLHPAALKDLDKSIAWYKEKGGKNLATKFLKDYQKTRQRILNNPLAFQKVTSLFRQTTFKQFPFVIIYHYTSTQVLILAVFHTSRDPEIWKKRK